MIKFEKEFLDVMLVFSKNIGAGLAVIALAGAGTGVGIVFAAFVISLSRNPLEMNNLFKFTMLGFAITESVGLLGLMMAFLILYS